MLQDKKPWRTKGRGFIISVAVCACAAAFLPMTTGQAAVAAGGTPAAMTAAAAGPSSATDESKVPHYFGPSPNWANSPFTLPTANVTFTDPSGTGAGAEAAAQVDPVTGGITAIDVTTPGHDYSGGTTVTVAGSAGIAATADATVKSDGTVVGLKVGAPGAGYTGFNATMTGGSGTGATAVASGGVDAVTVTDGGKDYTMPTVDFDLPDDPNGTTARGHVPMITNGDAIDGMTDAGTVTAVIVDEAGSGYSRAPGVAIHNGTLADPIAGATEATASSTLELVGLSVDTIGSGYTSAPTVAISDVTGGTGTGATATAIADIGAIGSVKVTTAGDGYLSHGMKKFQDELPLPCDPKADGSGCPVAPETPDMTAQSKFLPLGVPEVKTYNGKEADEYLIGLVQYRTQFSSDLPPTLVRGYVQLSTAAVPGQTTPLYNELLDGTKKLISGYTGVTGPQYLGPIITATKDRPVRIVFRNLLPTGADGDLFLPVDSTGMGAGMGPMQMTAPTNDGTVLDQVRNPDCTASKMNGCFADNRATLHLHGGMTPWISDGTPHQWITPQGENTAYPQGVSVQNVPDMLDGNGAEICAAKDDGCSTFYYTNQQSARLMFYHDHSYGITRLNVYAGEAAGYSITDDTEKKLIADKTIPGTGDTLPLIVQDRTFVPDAKQLAAQDPTWDTKKWGTKGGFWYHHVYMPAQNPGDPSGMSAYGRWMYGPWFWPPAGDTKYGPIANPYYDPSCKLDVPSTWQYQTDPFCEPEQIPGTPNISMGMEQFNDTPLVNGVAYPKMTVQPKTYRMRLLNAANDRFFNFQWYTADPNQGNGKTEVALKPGELAAAQTDPNVSPTPVDANNDAAGPDWIQIANEGGFLPAPAIVDGQQPTTWIIDPTRFDVGNVDKHSLAVAPAERADVLVDFSKFAGKTLILYNDAPAAYPARVASYDYFTGAPDLSPVGAPTILPGYGPNTRTVMQVTVADTAPQPAFDLTRLRAAFRHNAKGTGVFESGQNPVIVGQAAYNSAYGSAFAASSNCNVKGSALTTCDGLVRVNDTSTFGFNTLKAPNAKMSMPLAPKAIHDEMNATTFDEFGRMQANLGIEAQPPTPGAQNVTLYPYVNPQTELIDGTNLPADDVKVTPIGDARDGTQIWRFTHNGVDTHPIHFHLYDVQVLNRVTWDNIVIPTEPSELGWKDTVRMSPLEDTIVALRPIVPKVPFEVPNSVRPLNPAMPDNSTDMFNNVDPQGNPTDPITNKLVNFGWEYVLHCHILSHEEMDMMRPVSLALPPRKPDGLSFTMVGSGADQRFALSWQDNSITETDFQVQRSSDQGATWATLDTLTQPLVDNQHGTRAFTDTGSNTTERYFYRIVARNTVGYGGQFPSMTVQSVSAALDVAAPAAPSALTATVQTDPAQVAGAKVALAWTNNATNATNVVVERAVGSGAFAPVATLLATDTTWTDTSVVPGPYSYRVKAVNAAGSSAYAGPVTVTVAKPGSTMILVNAPGASTVGQPVTFTATVSPQLATGQPTGDVTFTVDGVPTGAVVGLTNGVATYLTSQLPAGPHTVQAAYGGDSVFLASAASVAHLVSKTATATGLVSSKDPSAFGDNVTFTATVSQASATGKVQFTIDGTDLGAPVDVVNGQAGFSTSNLAVAFHSVTATYSGDAVFGGSVSPTLTQSVGPVLQATRTVVTSNRTPSASFGQAVTFTARVSPLAGPGTPTGVVLLSVDGQAVALTLNGQGQATYSATGLSAGTHTVVASYGGSAIFAGSSGTLAQVVSQATSATVVTSNRNPSVAGQSVTFTARVTPAGTTGTVQFRIAGVAVNGPVPLDATGRATFVTSTFTVGSRYVSAVYGGNANYLGSTSAVLTQVVNRAASRTAVTSSRSSATRGSTVVLTAAVTAVAPGTGTAAGTVQFRIDGVNVGAARPLDASGRATYSTSTLSVGRHTVVAVYSGNVRFTGSTSRGFRQRVR